MYTHTCIYQYHIRSNYHFKIKMVFTIKIDTKILNTIRFSNVPLSHSIYY